MRPPVYKQDGALTLEHYLAGGLIKKYHLGHCKCERKTTAAEAARFNLA